MVAQLEAAREALAAITNRLVRVDSDDLARVAASAAAVVASAHAAQAAIVLESASRGVIAGSDHPRVDRWVEHSYREAGAAVSRAQARALHEVSVTCAGSDVTALTQAVSTGRIPVEVAAVVAMIYRRLRTNIECPNWDVLLNEIVDWAAEGASTRELYVLEDRLICQYGPQGELDRRRERDYTRRELTAFRHDRTGMLTATLRLDPASEATFTAAVQALAAPHLDEDGQPDPRTPGQRRADALLTLATLATTPDAAIPGAGASARLTLTMSLADLVTGLASTSKPDGAATLPVVDNGFATTGFGQIRTPTEARIAACDAEVIPAVMGTRGEILDLGRAARLINPGQRSALHLRERGCTYPGCTLPPAWCDGHHIEHWAAGGPTDMPNLTLLCRHHHTVVHRHGHTATLDENDTIRWTRSDGTPIGNTPRWAGSP